MTVKWFVDFFYRDGYSSKVIELFRNQYPHGDQEISTQDAWRTIDHASKEYLESIGQKPSVPIFGSIDSGRSGTCGGGLEFE